MVKRVIDIVGSLVGLCLFSPILLIAAIAIKCKDGGSVFFRQKRAGRYGVPFQMYKLRTMVLNADKMVDSVIALNPLQGNVYKIPNDPRITSIGKILRRWSLDEIPQFLNVLIGDMSLVGPRPEECWVVERYSVEERKRLQVKPGLVGPMQVAGRGDLSMGERLALELDYIEHYSIWKDLKILIKTIPVVISGKGAY